MSSQCQTLREQIQTYRARLAQFELEQPYLKKESELRLSHLALLGFSFKGRNGRLPEAVELAAMEAYLAKIPAMKTVLEDNIKNLEKELIAHEHDE